ncbi:MAG: polysaccharide deacetylase family protein [Clostridia bacterium]|nr:polysaccharide deacetylase family protein [Clostridia bacterium]
MKIFVTNKKRALSYIALIFCAISIITIGGIESVGVFKEGKEDRLLPIYSVDRGDEKVCALTFDAAWDDNDTDVLISVLGKYNAPATFFMVGSWVEKYPDSVKKFFDAGHEIMNHSDTHPHIDKLSDTKIAEEISKCNDKIEAATGVRPTLFRGPYGEYNNAVIKEAEKQNMLVIQWDVDSLDWKNLSAKEITERVTNRVKPGSIILFHNGAKNTPEALPMVLEALKNKGYTFKKASEMVYKENYTIDHSGKQILN